MKKKVRWSSSWKIFPLARKRLKDFKWWFIWRFHPEHQYNVVKIDLKSGYYNVDTRMLHACFSLLVEFIEKEHEGREDFLKNIEGIKKEYPNDHQHWTISKEEAMALYDWWKVQRPSDHAANDKEFSEYYKNVETVFEKEFNPNGTARAFSRIRSVDRNVEKKPRGYFQDQENALDMKDEEMLIRLMKIRQSLWT